MTRTWLALDRYTADALRFMNEASWTIDQVESADLSSEEIVLIGKGDAAKEAALGLVARGLSATKLSYVDLQNGDDISVRIQKPKHLFWDDVVPLAELDDIEDFRTYPSGVHFLDSELSWGWRIPELVVLAGPYGCGKSTIGQILAANFVHGAGRELDSGAMLCSWEDLSSEVYRNFKRFQLAQNVDDMLRRVSFVRRPPEADRLIGWYIDLVRYHRSRYGTRFFLLDPWNEMDHQKDVRMSETDYIKEMMKSFRRVVDEEQIILIIATHVPAKFIKGDGGIEPFKIGHSFGSSQFGNKADRGICVCRTKKYDKEILAISGIGGHTIIRHDKAKIERLMGRKGTVGARLCTETFSLRYDPFVTSEVANVWKD